MPVCAACNFSVSLVRVTDDFKNQTHFSRTVHKISHFARLRKHDVALCGKPQASTVYGRWLLWWLADGGGDIFFSADRSCINPGRSCDLSEVRVTKQPTTKLRLQHAKMYKFHVYVNSMCMSFQCDVFFFFSARFVRMKVHWCKPVLLGSLRAQTIFLRATLQMCVR